MKRTNIISLITAACMILLTFGVRFLYESHKKEVDHITVGFMYEGDESAPYTKNFINAQHKIEQEFGDRVTVVVENNVLESHGDVSLQRLVDAGCDIIFTNSYGYEDCTKEFASRYPNIQFCQATGDNANTDPVYDNYHTFMGRIYEGRYVAGVIAGMKLNQMIDMQEITESQAVIGYVAAFPYAEVISGYTAFFLGVRSVCPVATMKVRYTNTWSNYMTEKKCAETLIDEGCVLISQHSDTVGPAEACEKADKLYPVYHVGYNQSMIDIAPTTTLVSARIDWEPYMVNAVEAVLNGKKIEKNLDAEIIGNDACGGFSEGWVTMVELNATNTTPAMEESMEKTMEQLMDGKVNVFKGNYTGTDPFDPSDKIDLNTGFEENEESSAPKFHYVLDDVITVEE